MLSREQASLQYKECLVRNCLTVTKVCSSTLRIQVRRAVPPRRLGGLSSGGRQRTVQNFFSRPPFLPLLSLRSLTYFGERTNLRYIGFFLQGEKGGRGGKILPPPSLYRRWRRKMRIFRKKRKGEGSDDTGSVWRRRWGNPPFFPLPSFFPSFQNRSPRGL